MNERGLMRQFTDALLALLDDPDRPRAERYLAGSRALEDFKRSRPHSFDELPRQRGDIGGDVFTDVIDKEDA